MTTPADAKGLTAAANNGSTVVEPGKSPSRPAMALLPAIAAVYNDQLNGEHKALTATATEITFHAHRRNSNRRVCQQDWLCPHAVLPDEQPSLTIEQAHGRCRGFFSGRNASKIGIKRIL